MDDFFLPGLPPVAQEAFKRLLNRGIRKRHLGQEIIELLEPLNSGIRKRHLSQEIIELLEPESGSNANGKYVRWGNGFQVCWHYFVWPTSGGTKWWNSIYNWTYPVMFKERPNVHVVHGYAAPHEIGNYNSGLRFVTTTTAEVVLVEIGDYGKSTLSGYVEAKGWWK